MTPKEIVSAWVKSPTPGDDFATLGKAWLNENGVYKEVDDTKTAGEAGWTYANAVYLALKHPGKFKKWLVLRRMA